MGDALYQMVYNRLIDSIRDGTYPEGSRLPSEAELTKMYFVSRITTKKALNMLAQRGLVTRLPGKGTYVTVSSDKPEFLERLGRERTNLVGVILCNASATFGLDLLLGVEEEAAKHGYGMVFSRSYDSLEIEAAALRRLIDLGAEGIIIQPVHGDSYSSDIIQLDLKGFPLALVDRNMSRLSIPFAGTNNKSAAKQAALRLISMGHVNLAFLASPVQGTSTLEHRYFGVVEAFKEMGAPLRIDQWLTDLKSPLENSEQSNEEDIGHICQLLEKCPDVSCLFAAETSLAVLAHKACMRLGRLVPDDISIVCFDHAADYMGEPFFAHVRQRQAEMGAAACRLLIERIKAGSVPESIFLETDFISGETLSARPDGVKKENKP